MLLPWQDMQSLGGARDSNKGRGVTKLYQRKGQIDLELAGLSWNWGLRLSEWDPMGQAVLTEVLQDPVPLQLRVPNLVLQ